MNDYLVIGIFFVAVTLTWVATLFLAFWSGVKARQGETFTAVAEKKAEVFEPGQDEPEEVDEFEATWPQE